MKGPVCTIMDLRKTRGFRGLIAPIQTTSIAPINNPGDSIPLKFLSLMKKLLWVFFLAVILPGCKKQTTADNEVYTVEFSGEERENHSRLQTEIASVEYIALDTTELFGFVEKILVRDERIYIKDPYVGKLLVFNLDGTFLNTIGWVGRGPEEFLGITDFSVTDNCVLVYDGQSDRLLTYDLQGEFLTSREVPFKADALTVVDGRYFWALSSYNTLKFASRQVLLADADFKEISSWLEYPEATDTQFEFPYWFQTNGNSISYNRPIDNHIHLFSPSGDQKERIRVDFRWLDVPDSQKGDLARFFESGTPYAFMITPPVVTDRYIMGNLNRNGEISTFTVNRKDGSVSVCPMSELSTDNILMPMTSASDGRIVSCVNMDMVPGFETDERLSESMKQTLRGGGYVVILYTMKS